jgi:hypothetical protein
VTHRHRSRGPPILLYNGNLVFFPGVKRPGRGVDHPPASSAEVKERPPMFCCELCGFQCVTVAVFAVMASWAAQVGSCLPTFRDNLSIPSSIRTVWSLTKGPILYGSVGNTLPTTAAQNSGTRKTSSHFFPGPHTLTVLVLYAARCQALSVRTNTAVAAVSPRLPGEARDVNIPTDNMASAALQVPDTSPHAPPVTSLAANRNCA